MTKRQMKALFKKQKTGVQLLIAVLVVLGYFIYDLYILPALSSSETLLKQNNVSSQIKCVDGDTFWIGESKYRMLAIDTPEYTSTKEAYGKEASDYVCNALQAADSIELKQDAGNEIDKYDRILVWVFLDDELLQKDILAAGLGEIKYVDKNTVNENYLKLLEAAQQAAQDEQSGIWSDSEGSIIWSRFIYS